MPTRRRGRGALWPSSSLSLLAFAILIPCTTPRPVSLVHQEPESAPLRKGAVSETSAFAAAASAAKAAAAASAADKLNHDPRDDNARRSPQPLGAFQSVEVDGSLGAALVPEEGPQVRSLTVVGERTRLMVAGTVDGQVHALDPDTGDLRWSFSTGEPLVKSFQQLPGTLDEKRWLIPTLDGSMLVQTVQGLRRSPGLDARLLVEQTPFLAPEGTFYTGSKVSRIFGVDAHTGEVRQVLSGGTADSFESDRRLLARSGSDDDVIWIGRNDHTVRAFDVPTGQELWNLTVGEFVSLDGLYLASSSRKTAVHAAEAAPSLVATPDGSLRSAAVGKGGKTTGGNRAASEWNVPLPAHVASVFRVALEEGSAHTYLPMQQMPLSQSAGDGQTAVGSGSGGSAAVGMLDNGQVYAVALDDHDHDQEGEVGVDGGAVGAGGGGGGGGGRSAGGGGATGGPVTRGKKSRAGEVKVAHGGRAATTKTLLPHGDWQRDSGDGADHGLGLDGGGYGSLVQGFSKGSSHHVSGALRSCQPGHADFPNCLVGVHTVNQIGSEEQARLSLGMGSHASGALDGGAGGGAGNRDPKGVRSSTGYVSRLPPLSRGLGGDGGLAGMISGLGLGGDGSYLTPSPVPQGPLEALINFLYRGWSVVSFGLLAVLVMIIVDSRRAARFFKQIGLRGYPLYANGDAGNAEYDPSTDSGFSGVSESSASTAGGTAGSAVVAAGGVKGDLKVGCLTVSDAVLGYGSHGTVVYRGLLEGRPVAVKRMLTDFHARADREISLLIESDGHPNVVRYFVREEAGEFVYLALQLCQLSLHNAMAHIHATMAQARRKAELEKGGKAGAPRVGLGRSLTRDDVSAPPELRAALLQVSQGVEHLHSLRIVHRDLKPHNILLAAKDRKGPGLGRKTGGTDADKGEGKGQGKDEQEVPRKLSKMQDVASFVLKISDMGLGKQLLNGQSSFGMSSYGRMPGGRDQGQGGDAFSRARASNAQASSSAGGHVGSIGWQAPEVIADRVSLEGGQGPSVAGGMESSFASGSGGGSSWAMAGGPSSSSSRRTQAVDIFSLGCIFHHCIVPGSHPFGQWYEREANIIQNKASHLEELAHVPDAFDLVSLMTAREPDLRPSAGEVCKHPFFWNDEKRLSFLLEFSDRLEQDSVQSPLLVMIEAGADSVVGRSWDVRLDPELTEDAGRYRKYDFSSVRDLLRVVRNKRHHFHELPDRVQGLMSPLPGGFLRYVEGRFPQLLMHCAKVTGALLSEERLFKEYLVPFRRPPPPASQSKFTATTTPAASTAEGRRENREELPPALVLPTLSPVSTTNVDANSTKSSGLPSDRGTTAGVNGGFDSQAVRPNGLARGRAGSEGGHSGALFDGRGGSTSPVRVSTKATPRSAKPSLEGGVDTGVGAETKVANTGGVPVRVTEQSGPRGEGALQDVLLWNESAVAKSMGCRGWWRHQDHWQRRLDVTKQRPRGAHLNKALQDPKYRTRLCSHWENSKGMVCPMRRRGAGKCDFAHGGLELRVRANKRDRWGRHAGADGGGVSLDASGGEDTLGAARSIGRIRMENGTKDGIGSAAVVGGMGGGGAGGAGASGARQGKRSKGGGSQGGDGAGGGGAGWQGRARGGTGGNGDSKAAGLNGVAPSPQRTIGTADGRSPPGRGTRSDGGEAHGEVSPRREGAASVMANGAARPPSQLQGVGTRNGVQEQLASLPTSDSARAPRVDVVPRFVHGVGVRADVEGALSQERLRLSQERSQGRPAPVTPTGLVGGANGRILEGPAAFDRR